MFLKDAEIKSIIDEAVNDIYRKIQEKMGVKYGDNAGIFHSGNDIDEKLFNHFKAYVGFEQFNSK